MKIENTASAHNPTLSIAKALCIILMVVGHSGCPAYLHDWIYLFHMPCFFLISGYLLKDRYIDNLKLAVRKRLKGLWIPYVKWSILFLLLHNAFYRIGLYPNIYSFKEIIIKACKTLVFYGSEQLLWPFWFLSASLVASMIGLVYLKPCRQKRNLTLFSILGGEICVLIAAVVDYSPIKIPLLGSVQWLAASFFLMGYFFKRIQILQIPTYMVALMTIALSLTPILFTADINVKGWDCLMFSGTGIMGSMIVLKISAYLSKTKLSVVLDYIGSNTLYVLTFHLLAFKAVSCIKIVQYDMDWKNLLTIPVIEEYNQLYWLFYSVVGLMVPLMIQRLIRRTALPLTISINDTPTIYRHRKRIVNIMYSAAALWIRSIS